MRLRIGLAVGPWGLLWQWRSATAVRVVPRDASSSSSSSRTLASSVQEEHQQQQLQDAETTIIQQQPLLQLDMSALKDAFGKVLDQMEQFTKQQDVEKQLLAEVKTLKEEGKARDLELSRLESVIIQNVTAKTLLERTKTQTSTAKNLLEKTKTQTSTAKTLLEKTKTNTSTAGNATRRGVTLVASVPNLRSQMKQATEGIQHHQRAPVKLHVGNPQALQNNTSTHRRSLLQTAENTNFSSNATAAARANKENVGQGVAVMQTKKVAQVVKNVTAKISKFPTTLPAEDSTSLHQKKKKPVILDPTTSEIAKLANSDHIDIGRVMETLGVATGNAQRAEEEDEVEEEVAEDSDKAGEASEHTSTEKRTQAKTSDRSKKAYAVVPATVPTTSDSKKAEKTRETPEMQKHNDQANAIRAKEQMEKTASGAKVELVEKTAEKAGSADKKQQQQTKNRKQKAPNNDDARLLKMMGADQFSSELQALE